MTPTTPTGSSTETKKNNSRSKMHKQHEEQIQFDFCKVCKLNHNQGRRHIYFPNHKKALSSFLSRFKSKLNDDIYFFLKNPLPLRPELASRNRFWCVICDCDILESDSSFACGKAIQHLASAEHLKEVKDFVWKYGGDMKNMDSFRISESDFAKWEKKCNEFQVDASVEGTGGSILGPVNDIHNETNSECSNSFHKHDVFSVGFDFNFSNGVLPLQNHTNETCQILHSQIPRVAHDVPCLPNMCGGDNKVALMANGLPKGSSIKGDTFHSLPGDGPASRFPTNGGSSKHRCENFVFSGMRCQSTSDGDRVSHGSQRLAQISFTAREDGGGNVHSGAPPPWFNASERNKLNADLNTGNSSLSQTVKPSKLNPKRVGAAWAERRKIELELEKRGELDSDRFKADWLPNFGRVWQSGSRKESRKEFRVESKLPGKAECQEENQLQLQPYISKRMRRDATSEENALPTS